MPQGLGEHRLRLPSGASRAWMQLVRSRCLIEGGYPSGATHRKQSIASTHGRSLTAQPNALESIETTLQCRSLRDSRSHRQFGKDGARAQMRARVVAAHKTFFSGWSEWIPRSPMLVHTGSALRNAITSTSLLKSEREPAYGVGPVIWSL